VTEWLRPRGAVSNEAKTQIVQVNDGCDFSCSTSAATAADHH
jgi:hypothetical protein